MFGSAILTLAVWRMVNARHIIAIVRRDVQHAYRRQRAGEDVTGR